jgi:hypothetical protein
MKVYSKIKSRIWSKLVFLLRNKKIYPFLYRSYWHYLIFHTKKKEVVSANNTYYTAKPNYGAGIGHQMANWIAGYWYAKQFGVNFAHVPFSTKKWEEFLGFGTGDIDYIELLRNGYKSVKLPLFKESNVKEVALQKKIIASYKNEKVVFLAEQDQFYKDQFGVIQEMQNKFYNALSRKQDKLQFNNTTYNIAIHVRRGDIVAGQNKNDNHTMRWLTNNYFESVLQNTLDLIETEKKINIYLFSQGKVDDYKEFKKFSNLIYCLDMGALDSFLHMVYADVLITSKSSFSYKPALLNRGMKVVPKDFWHGYPDTNNWIKADVDGNLILK